MQPVLGQGPVVQWRYYTLQNTRAIVRAITFPKKSEGHLTVEYIPVHVDKGNKCRFIPASIKEHLDLGRGWGLKMFQKSVFSCILLYSEADSDVFKLKISV